MSRGSRSDVLDEVENVEDNEQEVVESPQEQAEGEQAPKAKKEPKRGDLPEGYVTPVGLAKVLTERGLHTNRQGEVAKVEPQMVYSYLNNNKEFGGVFTDVEDSIGATRKAVELETGVQAWVDLKTRANERRQNAAAKKAAKEERAAAKAAEKTEESEGGEEIAEAE
jgi:hypothetical protein